MKRFLKGFLAILFVASLFLVACAKTDDGGDPNQGKTPDPSTEIDISYDGGDITLEVGQEKTFMVAIKGASDVTYSVDNEEIISVAKGVITALKAGSAKITVATKEDPTKKVEINVTVTEKAPEPTKYTITYDLDGGTATGLVNEFEENDYPNLPIPTKEGFNFSGWFEGETEVSSINANKNYTLVAKWEAVQTEILPESIEIIVEMGDDDMVYADTECVVTCRVLPEGASQEVEWKNMNRTKATRNEDGTINVMHGNEASFKATSVANPDVTATVTLQVRTYMNPDRFIETLAVKSDEIVAEKIKAYPSDAGSDHYLLGSVFRILFEKLDIIENMVPVGAHNRPGRFTDEGVEAVPYFVTVHDVGAPGNAQSNSNYCVNPGAGNYLSWHYTTGNDGIYQQLPIGEIGYHAADGTHYDFQWSDSGILAPEGENNPTKITINQTTGKYQINGQDTLISAPLNASGSIPTNSSIIYTGINNIVDNDPTSSTYRHYLIGTTYWNKGYGVLANYGGNVNSVGIETQVLGNTYYTWERTAKLIATVILPEIGQNVYDAVKQHNTFCGKDCPMTMRHAGYWEHFLNLIQCEYILASQFYNFKIEFKSDSPYLNPNGMIKTLANEATEVEYSVRFYSTSENYDKTFNYKVTLPAKSVITY